MAQQRKSHVRTTAQRGYGTAHQRRRKQALAAMRDGDPCCRCGRAMYRTQQLHLDHSDHDRSRYLGLAHAVCNERAGALKLAATNRGQANRPEPRPNPSQAW